MSETNMKDIDIVRAVGMVETLSRLGFDPYLTLRKDQHKYEVPFVWRAFRVSWELCDVGELMDWT